MEYRELGSTHWRTSVIGFGAWPIGEGWGQVQDSESLSALHRAVDLGVNFFDTADVYGDGRSERLLAQLRRERSEVIYIATKIGGRLSPVTPAGYNRKNLTAFVERSLRNLNTEALDLIQLHCPPTQVYYMPEVFGILDDLIAQGKLRFYGVSVEKVEEGLKAIEYPGVQSVQIIFNLFRQRPADLFLSQAEHRRVGVLARLPLSSGMLTGKMTPQTTFSADDHRSFNRHGEAFDIGETFSGVEFETGLRAVEELRPLVPQGMTMAQFALRWILSFPGVTAAIPGAKHPNQVEENVHATEYPILSETILAETRHIYERHMREQVHHRW
jgi:aryl-alcohol dehydrogenase-like predicted oxidoreductase